MLLRGLPVVSMCPALKYQRRFGGKLGNRTLEPPRLHTNCTTLQRPRRAVRRRAHTTTGIHPLHAKWKRLVCD